MESSTRLVSAGVVRLMSSGLTDHIMPPGTTQDLVVGLPLYLQEGHCCLIVPKRSVALLGLDVLVEVLDSQVVQQGIRVGITNRSSHPIPIRYNQVICQMVILPCYAGSFLPVQQEIEKVPDSPTTSPPSQS